MSTGGLSRQRWIEPLESFVREHGHSTPRWAVICTYECDVGILDRQVLPVLTRRNRAFRVVVLADAGTLEERFRAAAAPKGTVNIHAVRLRKGGIFHPKLVLLRAGSAVRVCFGSANISAGGFGANLELWSHSDEPEIVESTADLLARLTTDPQIVLDATCRRQLRRALVGIRQRASHRLWSSLDRSFANHLRLKPPPDRWGLTVVSPAYASSTGARLARRVFKNATATIYTDQPVPIPNATTRVYSPPDAADDKANADVGDYPSRLHAKLYLVHGPNAAEVWLGSANFTAKALAKPVSGGGNLECLFRSDLPVEEVRTLLEELDKTFLPPGKLRPWSELERDEVPVSEASIIGGELNNGRAGWRLTLYTVPGTLRVVIECGGKRATIPIRGERGVLCEGDLRRLLPELLLNGPSVRIIYEIVNGDRVPILINVPFVPDPADDGSSEAHLDVLLDELRGRLPTSGPTKDDGLSQENIESSDDDSDPLLEDFGRRIDEARHQGELDRVAVKAAMARRLILSRTKPGHFRDELLRLTLSVCEAACPPSVRPILAEWFHR
jgi:hypothetical protein